MLEEQEKMLVQIKLEDVVKVKVKVKVNGIETIIIGIIIIGTTIIGMGEEMVDGVEEDGMVDGHIGVVH